MGELLSPQETSITRFATGSMSRASPEVRARHLRHHLVGQEQGDGLPGSLEAAELLERRGRRLPGQHPVVPAVPLAHLLLGDRQAGDVVVDDEDDRLAAHVLTSGLAYRFCLPATRHLSPSASPGGLLVARWVRPAGVGRPDVAQSHAAGRLPSVTVMSCAVPLRTTVSVAVSPGCFWAMAAAN